MKIAATLPAGVLVVAIVAYGRAAAEPSVPQPPDAAAVQRIKELSPERFR